MTVEGFHARYLPDVFATDIVRRQDFGIPTKIQSIAEMYRNEGSQGVRDLGKAYAQKDGALKAEETLAIMLPEDKYSLGINLSGVVFGLSLRAIEIALIEKQFGEREFFAKLKDSLVGTPWADGLTVPDEQAITVPGNYWQAMIDVAKIDRTLGSFFINGTNRLLLPEMRRAMSVRLAGMSMFHAMQEGIVPNYIIRAQGIFAKPSKKA
jgi:hypothetical protein